MAHRELPVTSLLLLKGSCKLMDFTVADYCTYVSSFAELSFILNLSYGKMFYEK